MIKLCQVTSLFYLFPFLFLLWNETNYMLSVLFLSLTIFAFVNHSREYTCDPHYDLIDIIDRILIVLICSYFIIHHYSFLYVWFALSYMFVAYFWLIPKYCSTKELKIVVHSSFHVVTSISALFILLSLGR